MNTFSESGKHNQIVLGAALFVISAPLEICRLYLGYSGNLREKVLLHVEYFTYYLFDELNFLNFFFYK